MTDAATLEAPAPDDTSPEVDKQPHLGWLVAGMSAAAGVIHFAMVPAHAGDGLTDPIGFALVGWFQLMVAAAILANRGGRNVYKAAIIGNLVVIGLWIWSRTAGLPIGSHAGEAEDASTIDVVSTLLEAGVVLVSARMLMSPGRVAVGKLAPVMAGVAALGLATMVISSADAAEHGGAGHSHGDEVAADGHAHGTSADTGHADLMASIDAARCDKDFNIDAYWTEAKYLGVDTYQGGTMSMTESSGDHHSGGGTAAGEDVAGYPTSDPLDGRGSEGLDQLLTLTASAGTGEVADARMVAGLGRASEADYQAWLWYLRSKGMLSGHSESHASGSGDDTGHGGHLGPQPWVAMTDQAQCDKLADEIELARKTALKYPTAADATEAGWGRVTGYVPGIAAHYIKGANVDGTFEIDQPEMLLYDGNGPDAHMVGLSYYVIQEGDIEPSQGFTGDNDHSHRHIGLCIGAGGVIGDSTTTEEECAARGGSKANNGNGWMSHAWVVPGCESAWGVFSAASPLLDLDLEDESGKTGIGCEAAGVRDRYNMGSGAEPASSGGG